MCHPGKKGGIYTAGVGDEQAPSASESLA
jgi:hypothetical protein